MATRREASTTQIAGSGLGLISCQDSKFVAPWPIDIDAGTDSAGGSGDSGGDSGESDSGHSGQDTNGKGDTDCGGSDHKTMPVPKVLVVLATTSDEPGQDGSSAKVLAMTTVTYLITAWYQRQRL